MPSLPSLALALAALVAPSAAAQGGQTTAQFCPPSQTIPLTTTNWQLPLTFQRFDPALGVLLRVDIAATSQIEVSARFECLDSEPAVVTLTRAGTVVLRNRADTMSLLTSSPSDMFTENVTAFDGNIDFMGGSGRTYPAVLLSEMTSSSTTAPSELALFTGLPGNPGTVSLPASGAGNSIATGPGNITSQINTRAGVSVTVCYVYAPDCNGNGISDDIDIANGQPDRYGPGTCAPDGIPDSCQPESDCDHDGLPDRCELAGNDCDHNGVPDNCQPDCDHDGIPDACAILTGSPDRYGPTTCSPDGIPDECQPAPDCDEDGLPDRCELAGNDCDANGIPDDCQPDCDDDGVADACEILQGAPDLYCVGICAPDGIPDECQHQPDCDHDGVPDYCEIESGAPDSDGNGVPDNCQPSCVCVNPVLGLGAAGGCTVLQLGSGKVDMTGPAGGVLGKVCIGPGGKLSMSGSQYVTGEVHLAPGATFSHSGSTTTGTVLTNVDLSAEINAALAAASSLATLPCTQTFASLNNNLTIVGNGGQNVICVTNVELNGKTVLLSGGASDKFVFNVTGKFKFTGSGRILVSGLPASNVIYNVIGSSEDIAFSGGGGGIDCCNSQVDGTILAPNRKIALSPGLVNGQIISGKDISIVSGASVRCPPCAITDCNRNGIDDALDISGGASRDANQDGVPDACQPGITTFCVADGAANGGADCPCPNNAPQGTTSGCLNKSGVGAQLTGSGVPSVSSDTLLLTVSGIPNGAPGYFFQGENNAGFNPYFNGLRCVGGPYIRMAKIPAFPGGFSLPLPGGSPISQQFHIPAGATRYYQVLYRDIGNPLCPNGANISNGVKVVWGM